MSLPMLATAGYVDANISKLKTITSKMTRTVFLLT